MNDKQRLVVLLTDFQARLQELDGRHMDMGHMGYKGFLSLADEIEVLRTKVKLPPILKCSVLPAPLGAPHFCPVDIKLPGLLSLTVWDLRAGKASSGYFTELDSPTKFHLTMRIHLDLLSRAIRYVEAHEASEQPPTVADDGPCEPKTWRQNGQVVEKKMATTAWELARFLWNSNDHSASSDEMAESVFGDKEEFIDGKDVRKHASNANRFFKAHFPPLACKRIETTRWLVRRFSNLKSK